MDDAIDTVDTPTVEDLTLVALTPADMAPAQRDLATWCDRKIEAVQAELRDLETNLELATEHGWKHESVVAAINRTKKRVLYYEKIKAAVAAGYLIVPNFPVDLLAVRVRRQTPPAKVHDSVWGGFRAEPELLPAGEGRYVDDQLLYRDESKMQMVEGKEKLVKRYVISDYDAVDFPVLAVRPAILEATQRAMALKVFDEIGMVQNRTGRDPIVVGRLRDPRGSGTNLRYTTFFIAWWLDTATL